MSISQTIAMLLILTVPHRGEDEIDLARVPEVYRERAAESWRLAGRQRGELEEFLAGVEDSLMEEASFLVANLPYRDLGVVEAALLRENLIWAVKARESMPWGHDVPDELFLHYVLPHRVSQERWQSWRPFFYERLAGVLSECGGMTEAALAVNRWLDDQIDFVSTERRDQGPVTTVRRGIGRCEEMTIAFIAASRAVGIPARQCWTPWWSLADNNHAWAEVWADGAWHYVGAGEASEQLDRAWFTEPVRHAAAVYSLCFGRWAGRDVYKEGERFSIINSTAVYAVPCTLLVRPLGEPGTVTAAVSVFNYGVFRPVAEQEIAPGGDVRFVVGAGTYLVTAGDDSRGFWRLAEVRPDSVTTVTEFLAPPAVPAGFLWLRGGR